MSINIEPPASRTNSDEDVRGSPTQIMSSKENSPERPSDNAQQNGDSEKGDEKPKPVGLFSPELKHVRREIAWKWLLTTVILMIAIMAVLSLCEFE